MPPLLYNMHRRKGNSNLYVTIFYKKRKKIFDIIVKSDYNDDKYNNPFTGIGF